MNNLEIEYTKINLLWEHNCDKAHNFYYIYYGKIFNKEHTRYRKFKYIEMFDIFDLQEYYQKDNFTKEDIRNYALTTENSYLLAIKDYNDTKGLKEFYSYCNDTIKKYNEIASYWTL